LRQFSSRLLLLNFVSRPPISGSRETYTNAPLSSGLTLANHIYAGIAAAPSASKAARMAIGQTRKISGRERGEARGEARGGGL
jgi:hypothetical protein